MIINGARGRRQSTCLHILICTLIDVACRHSTESPTGRSYLGSREQGQQHTLSKQLANLPGTLGSRRCHVTRLLFIIVFPVPILLTFLLSSVVNFVSDEKDVHPTSY